MEKRKQHFENGRDWQFPDCITAVGKGLRKTWGNYSEKRKVTIKFLKKEHSSWQDLVSEEIKLAWMSRKIHALKEDEADLKDILATKLVNYSAKEINWMRKIHRSLRKSLQTHKDSFSKLSEKMVTELPNSGKLDETEILSPLCISPPPPLLDFTGKFSNFY